MPRFTRTAVLIATGVAAAGVVAAAFGRSDGVPVPKGYSGVEASLPVAYKTPAKKGGACTIGFQNPIAGNETLHTLQLAVVAQAKVFGCKVITSLFVFMLARNKVVGLTGNPKLAFGAVPALPLEGLLLIRLAPFHTLM